MSVSHPAEQYGHRHLFWTVQWNSNPLSNPFNNRFQGIAGQHMAAQSHMEWFSVKCRTLNRSYLLHARGLVQLPWKPALHFQTLAGGWKLRKNGNQALCFVFGIRVERLLGWGGLRWAVVWPFIISFVCCWRHWRGEATLVWSQFLPAIHDQSKREEINEWREASRGRRRPSPNASHRDACFPHIILSIESEVESRCHCFRLPWEVMEGISWVGPYWL